MKATIRLIDKIHRATGENVALLTSDEWRKAHPLAQRILIQEYLKETGQSGNDDGVHLPDNYMDLLIEAINYFFTPSPSQENGPEKMSNTSSG